MAVSCRLRFGAHPSDRDPVLWRGEAVALYADFFDSVTNEATAVTGVTATVYLPSNAQLDPAPTPSLVSGTTATYLIAFDVDYAGVWRATVACTGPDAAVDQRSFVVSETDPGPTVPEVDPYVISVAGRSGAVTLTAADIGFTADAAGAQARTLAQVLNDNRFHVRNFGAVGNGTTSDSTAFQAAMDACSTAGGGVVKMDAARFRWATDVTMPQGVFVEGEWETAGKRNNADYDTQKYVILKDASARLQVLGNAGMRKCGLFRYGLVKPANTVRAMLDAIDDFGGTGIEAKGDDTIGSVSECAFQDMTILGFDLGLDIYRGECHDIARLLIDCTAGYKIERVRDIARIEDVHMWPAVTAHQSAGTTSYAVSAAANSGGLLQLTLAAHPFETGDRVNVVLTTGGTLRKRTAITVVSGTVITCQDIPWDAGYAALTGVVWPAVYWREGIGAHHLDHEAVTVRDVFAYGHGTGLYAGDGVSWLRAFGYGYDNYLSAGVDSSVAIDIAGTARGLQFIGGETNSCGVALRVNSPGTLHHKIIGMELNVYTGGKVFDLLDGRTIFAACETSSVGTGTIAAAVEDVVFSATRMASTTVTNSAAESQVHVDGATTFAARIKARSTLGKSRIGAPGENIAVVLDQVGADVSQGAQIEWGSGTKLYERVTPSGSYQMLSGPYALLVQVTQAGTVTLTGDLVTPDANVTDDLVVGDALTVTGLTTLGSATAEVGGANVLDLRGSQTGNPNAGAQIRQTNPDAPSLPVFTRVSTSGAWFVLNASGAVILSGTQAGAVTAPGLTVTTTAAVGGALTVTGAAGIVGGAIVGSPNSNEGPTSALHVRGNPSGDSERSAEIRQENQDGGYSVYMRVETDGRWKLIDDQYSLSLLTVTQDADAILGGGALANGATKGFLHLPHFTGAPSGTIVTYTGRVPMAYRSDTHQWGAYHGGVWRWSPAFT
jgi:hypothetical protein